MMRFAASGRSLRSLIGCGGGGAALHLEERLAVARAERKLSRRHLEEEDPERVEITRRDRILATRLLGRHVLGRSEHRALRREPRITRESGQTEVEDLHVVLTAAALREHDVVALEVAVDDPEVVGTRERGGHLLDDVDGPRHGHLPLGDDAGEAGPREVLHHQVELALFGLAHVVDVDDVRVIDPVRRASFAKHPRAQVRLAFEVGPDQLQRHHPIDEHVTGAIDHTHTALAEARLEAISPCDDLSEIRVFPTSR